GRGAVARVPRRPRGGDAAHDAALRDREDAGAGAEEVYGGEGADDVERKQNLKDSFRFPLLRPAGPTQGRRRKSRKSFKSAEFPPAFPPRKFFLGTSLDGSGSHSYLYPIGKLG